MHAKSVPLQDILTPQFETIESFTSKSFFASKNFLKLWESMSGNPVYWILEENKKVLAVLPAVEFGTGKLKRLQALTDGCYSGIYTIDDKHSHKYKSELLQAILGFGYQKLYIFDFMDSIKDTAGYDILECQTTLVDVSSKDWLPPDKKLQSEIRKAERENVVINKFNFDTHFEKFIKLMKETEKRHNRKPKYSDSFFEALAKLAMTENRIVWKWCEYEGNAVSSHINFIENNQIFNWQVYFDKEYSFLKANQKMIYDLAGLARENDLKYINLGASPIETPTLKEYKDKWGGETKKYNCYYKKTLLGKLF